MIPSYQCSLSPLPGTWHLSNFLTFKVEALPSLQPHSPPFQTLPICSALEHSPHPPIPDATPQKACQGSAPPLELLKTTHTGCLRPGHQTCHVISLPSSRVTWELHRCALLCVLNLFLFIGFVLAYCIMGGYTVIGSPILNICECFK